MSILVRRIRVRGVPADFRVPRGWPTPTDRWIRANAFWQPPAGWTPLSGLRPAPRGWTFWVPNPLMARSRAGMYRGATIWSQAGGLLFIAAIAARIAFTTMDVPVGTLGQVFALAGAACMVGFIVAHRYTTTRALEQFSALARAGRAARLTREYQKYLVDAG